LNKIQSDSIFTLVAQSNGVKSTATVFDHDGVTTHRVSSFWMNTGAYDFEITMYRESNSNNKMKIIFEAEIELTAYMIGTVAMIYLVFVVIAIQAIISNDYYCFKHIVYSAQLIHLMSMLAVNLPPHMVYLIQRMSIFGFIEGIFGKKFIKSSFNDMDIDRFYRANYESTSFIANQALSIIMITLCTEFIAIRHYLFKSKNNENNESSNEDKVKIKDVTTGHKIWGSKWFAEIKCASFNIFSLVYPYLLLHSVIDIIDMGFKSGLTTTSFFIACFVLMLTIKFSILFTLLAISNYRKITNSKYNEDDIIHDNLFNNLRVKNMIKTHFIFWTKRAFIILVIVISPYIENTYTIIAGFIILLCYTSIELEYRATTNKLEFLYILICYLPPLITSFIAMLMEGHYIKYESKLIVNELTLAAIMLVYLLVIPLRFLDYYKYQKTQRLKRIEKYKSQSKQKLDHN